MGGRGSSILSRYVPCPLIGPAWVTGRRPDRGPARLWSTVSQCGACRTGAHVQDRIGDLSYYGT